jgi:hypothetical protein
MEGIGEALGFIIIISYVLLAYLPIVAIMILKQMGLYKSLNGIKKIFAYVGSFVGLALLTLLTMRTFPYVSLDWLVLSAILLTIISFFNIYRRRKLKRVE